MYSRKRLYRKAKESYKNCRYDFYGSIQKSSSEVYGIVQVINIEQKNLETIIQAFFVSDIKLFKFGKETYVFSAETSEAILPLEELTNYIQDQIKEYKVEIPCYSSILYNKSIPHKDIIEILFGGLNICKRYGTGKVILMDFENVSTYDLFGITKQGYIPFYQPIFDADRRQVTGVESLVRWSSNNQLFPPNVFVPTAIKRNLIAGIDIKVITEALKLNNQLSEMKKSQIPISINVSPESFSDSFISRIESLLKIYAPESVQHIVFDFKLSDFDVCIIEWLKSIVNLGFGLCIKVDQFDAIKLEAIHKRVHFDYAKVDKKFIRQKSYGTIHNFFKAEGVHVIGVYIESEEEEELVKHFDIRELQGFRYEKPINQVVLYEKYILRNWAV